MKWRTLAVLLLCVVAARTRGQEPSVTIAPQTLSFAEIAQQLSTGGRKIECSPRLKDCAAFVCLTNRSWEQARSLLSAGLGVQFRKQTDSPNVWVMARDPQTVLREQKWLEAFAQGLRAEMQVQLAVYAPYLAQPYAPIRSKHGQLREEYNTALAADKQQPTAATRARVLELSQSAKALPNPQEWMSAKLLTRETPTSLVETLKTGYTLTELDPAALSDRDLLLGLIASAAGRSYSEEPEAADLTAHYRAYGGFSFQPEELLFVTQVIVCDAQERAQEGEYLHIRLARGEHPLDTVFKGNADPGSAYKGLGRGAVEWRASERSATRAFLQTEAAQKKLDAQVWTGVTSVSQAVEAWSRAAKKDAVCELLPARERLKQEWVMPRLADVFREEGAWTLREQDGALLVTDQLAFVDRLRSFPLAAFLQWERAEKDVALPASMAQSANLKALTAYAAAVTPEQNGQWLCLNSLYRNHAMSAIARARPVGLLLTRMGSAEKRACETALATQGKYEIPVSRLGNKTQEIVDSYRAMRYGTGRMAVRGCLHPAFADKVQNATLRLYAANPDDAGKFFLMAELAAPTQTGQAANQSSLETITGTPIELCDLKRTR